MLKSGLLQADHRDVKSLKTETNTADISPLLGISLSQHALQSRVFVSSHLIIAGDIIKFDQYFILVRTNNYTIYICGILIV